MIAAFCERIGLPALDILISKFHGRVLHGIKEDLISLTTIRGVKGFTARLLYTSGLHSVEEVASAEPEDIHAALVNGKQPDTRGGEWRQARSISNNARRMVKVRGCGLAPCCDVVQTVHATTGRPFWLCARYVVAGAAVSAVCMMVLSQRSGSHFPAAGPQSYVLA